MNRFIGAALVVSLFALLLILPRLGQRQPPAPQPAPSAPYQAQPASYNPSDVYLSYFSGHWCNCWRRNDLPPFEELKSYEGVLPRAKTPAWAKNKLIMLDGLSPAEKLAARAFAGIVNRRVPMWYLVERGDFWLRGRRAPWRRAAVGDPLMGIWARGKPLPQQVGYRIDKSKLLMGIKRFVNELQPPEFNAIVLYDPALLDPNAKPAQPRAVLNVVRTLCAVENALPLTPELYRKFVQQSWSAQGMQDRVPQLPVLDTTQMKQWNLATYNGDEKQATMAVYTWALNNLWDKCLKFALVFIPPLGSAGETDLTDYVTQFDLFTFYIDGDTNMDERTLELILSKTPQNCPIIGVIGTKDDPELEQKRTRLLRLFSRFGKFFIDCRGARNISYHSGERPVQREPLRPKPPRQVKLEANKKYLAFCLTCGNSLGYFLNERPVHWDYQSRGSLPLGWAIPLAAADAFPNLLKYFYLTASANDCFVADMSGMGEIHAPVFGEAFKEKDKIFQYFLQSTAGYMSLLGIDTLWVDAADEQTLQRYTTVIDGLRAILYGTNAAGEYLERSSFRVGQRPVFCAFRSVAASRKVLENLPAELRGRPERFVFVGIDETQFSPEEDVVALIARAARALGNEYLVVRPDELAALYQQAVAAGLAPEDKPALVAQATAQKELAIAKVARGAIAIDGALGDWRKLGLRPLSISSAAQVAQGAEQRQGASDLSATVYLAYDEDYLYLAAAVRDDVVHADDFNPAACDSVELVLDARRAPFREPRPTEGFYRLRLTPAAGLLQKPKLSLIYPTFDVGPVSMNRHGIEEILASVRTSEGYVIEAALPLLNFPRARFAPGAELGFGLAINDFDRGPAVEARMEWQAKNSLQNALNLARARLS